MKKLLSILFLCAVISVPVLAQEDEVEVEVFSQAPQQQERGRNMFITLGFAGSYMGEAFVGGGMSYGYYPAEHNLFTFEVNAGYYDAGKIGWFKYLYYGYDYYGDIKYSYVSLQCLLTWNYVAKISEKASWRFGPSIGVLSITGSESYDPSDVKGLPTSTSETKTAFTAGIGTGITINFLKRWFVDFGYRYLANSGITFDAKTIRILGTDIPVDKQEFDKSEHQFNITAGWRF